MQILLTGEPLPAIARAHRYLRQKTQKATYDLTFTDNVVSATRFRDFIHKLAGVRVYCHDIRPGNVVVSRLSILGLICFIIWTVTFIVCIYISIKEKLSVIRTNFDTKLREYGDLFERYQAILYMAFLLYIVPFRIGKNTDHIQLIVDADVAINKYLHKKVAYDMQGVYALGITLVKIMFSVVQTICLVATQDGLITKTPIALMFIIIYSDVVGMSLTSYYFYYLLLLRQRFFAICETLKALRDDPDAGASSKRIQEACDMLRGCAIIYGMLNRRVSGVNELFGVGLVITITASLLTILLNVFYLMEVNASGALAEKNPKRYLFLMVYLSFEMVLAVCVVVVNVYSCQTTVKVVERAPFQVHDIINRNLSREINSVGMTFSEQLFQQMPFFSAGGLYLINYRLLVQGSRFILMFIAMVGIYVH